MLWNYSGHQILGSDLYEVCSNGLQKVNSVGPRITNQSFYTNSISAYDIVVDGQQRLSALKSAFNPISNVCVTYSPSTLGYTFSIKKKISQVNDLYLSDFYSPGKIVPNEFTQLKATFDAALLIGYRANNATTFDMLIDIFERINTKGKTLQTGDIFINALGSVGVSNSKKVQNFFKGKTFAFNSNILIGLAILLSSAHSPKVSLQAISDNALLSSIVNYFSIGTNCNVFEDYLTKFLNNEDIKKMVAHNYRTALMMFFVLKKAYSNVPTFGEKYLLLLLLVSVGKANSQNEIENFWQHIDKKPLPSFLEIICHFSTYTNIQDFICNIVDTTMDVNIQKIILYIATKCGSALPGLKFDVDHLHPYSRGGSDLVYNKQLLYSYFNKRKSNIELDVFMKTQFGGTLPRISFDPTIANNSTITYSKNDENNFYNARKELIICELIKYFK